MILNKHEQHVKGAHGLGEQKAFTIQTNAHAFKMLSSGLYSDKISAVLREIGCNATDAHTEYGTADVPIVVKLPNKIDNQFYIRDMGPGLKHEDVMDLYTTYFASTKQQSNSTIGGFGLGSKSPFSYVDSFTVTSVHMGTARTYSAHLDNTGSPTIALLSTQPADKDWQHGVQIGFAVKPNDYPYFQQKAQNVFQWFRITPKIVGAAPITPISPEFDSPEFMYHKEFANSVLMGGVRYPLDVSKLEGASSQAKLMTYFPHIILKLPIGSVQVAVSREELQYDKAGIKVLTEAAERAVKVIVDDAHAVASRFQAAPWDVKCKTHQIRTKWELRAGNWRDVFSTMGYINAATLADALATRNIPLPMSAGTRATVRLIRPAQKTGTVSYLEVRGGNVAGRSYPVPVNVTLEEKTRIIYGKAKNTLIRARSAVLGGSISQLILITPHVSDQTEAASKHEAEELSKYLSGAPLSHINTLPSPLSGSATRQKKQKNSHQLPLPAKQVGVMGLSGIVAYSYDISKSPAKHFMCRTPEFDNYSSQKAVRVYNVSFDADKAYNKHTWVAIVSMFNELQTSLGAKVIVDIPLPTAAEIRELDLVKRGWVSTADVMHAWLIDPNTLKTIENTANTWEPSVAFDKHLPTWVGALLDSKRKNSPNYMLLQPILAAEGVDQIFDKLLASTKRAGNKAGLTEPPEVTAYNALSIHFLLPPIKVTKRTFVTLEDLETQLLSKYPALKGFTPNNLWDLGRFPSKLTDFAKILFS